MKTMNRKNSLCLTAFAAVLFAAGQAQASPEQIERVLKDETTISVLELNAETVFCTDKGYGNVQLKVSVPELDHLAHFDHRVSGESLPCITGGQCAPPWDPTGPGLKPSDIIVEGSPFAVVPIRVVLSETLDIDREKRTCVRRIIEKVTSHIRGTNFNHYRNASPEQVAFEKCSLVVGL